MTSPAFERMRLQSHAAIKRQIEYRERRSLRSSLNRYRRKTCQYSAHSPFLLCAVNPLGVCKNCIHYQPIERSE
ncbi:MAG: hypothetical protein J7647_19065 [Cyanobacteria bacterium SBLK]|nr:hypothetical protein [Cyanobacteria bacterium SBLK]